MLKRTPLFEEHKKLNGRLIDFGGWELPVQYTGLSDEHLNCRENVGLFDVSHMGEFIVEGSDAETFLNEALTNDVKKLIPGQAQYSLLCYENGTLVDDLLVYKYSTEKYLVVVNASNIEKDFEYMSSFHQKGKFKCHFQNKSDSFAQIALQGRHAEKILQKLSQKDLSKLAYYHFHEETLKNGIPSIVSRTGYTGEDGFEIYCANEFAPKLWETLLELGNEYQIKPCGLGARDTLRLEVRFPLYGHELSDKINALEAGLGWVIKFDKEKFIGKEALLKIKEEGLKRKCVGIKLLAPGVIRQDYKIFSKDTDKEIGFISSGTLSPSLKTSIGLGYVESSFSQIGTKVSIEIRSQKIDAEIIPTPFYKRNY